MSFKGRGLCNRLGGFAAVCATSLFVAEADPVVTSLAPWEVVAPADPLGLPKAPLLYAIPLDAEGPGLRSLFRRVPGLLVQESFGGVDPPRVSARGSGIQSAPLSRGLWIAFNGLPLNFADGSFNLALIENAWLDQVQFVPGPVAGVPSLGGALSLWSQGGRFQSSRRVRAGVGSNGTVFTHGQWVGQSETKALATEAAFIRSDGWRDQSAQRRETVWSGVEFQRNKNTALSLQVYAARPRFEVPGPLSKSLALTAPKSNFQRVLLDRPERSTDYLRVGGTLRSEGADGFVALSLFGVYHSDDFRQLLANGITQSRSREGGLTLDLMRETDTLYDGQAYLRLLFQTAHGDTQRFATAGGQAGVKIGDNVLRPDTLNLRLGQQLEVADNHQLDVGFGVIAARRVVKERFEGRPSTALSDSAAKLTPFVAWTYSPAEQWKLRLSYARGYEPPTFNDLLFTEFNPPPPQPVLRSRALTWQRADSFDLRLEGGNERLTFSSGPHYALWRNEWLRLVDGGGAALGTVNAHKTLHAGWETTVSWLIHSDNSQQWSLWLNHQYLDIRFDDDPVYGNGRLGGIPPHSGALGLRGDFSGGWFIAPELTGQAGPTYADHRNTLSSSGFGIWNLDTGRVHPAGWLLGLRVTNLLNRRAIASTAGVLDAATLGANQAIFLPTTGRRVELRMEYRW